MRNAAATDGGFEVTTADGSTIQARRLLLATEVTDELPPIDGLARLWGCGVYHCPYCTAGKHADRRSRCSAATTMPLIWR